MCKWVGIVKWSMIGVGEIEVECKIGGRKRLWVMVCGVLGGFGGGRWGEGNVSGWWRRGWCNCGW